MLALAFLVAVCLHLGTPLTVNDCPAGLPRDTYLQVHGNSCWQFVLFRRYTHSKARQDCEKNGGTLALVKDAETQSYLYHELLNTYRSHSLVWIGLNDLDNENVYKWEDGTPLDYHNWDSGEGPGAGSITHIFNHESDDCVTIDASSGGKWAEYPCDSYNFLFFADPEEHYYICQFQVSASTSTTAATTVSSTEVTPAPQTTVSTITNPCSPFSCDLDCGMNGFKKDPTTGCSLCECDA
ncbi:macrophage mannose receptor 1-like [Physella acuta]|uniref:macrophage mannose receptor 1-like n=1 Tax=Physella acuta TaxID=109671 RepID=UPI0027DB727B|nr:macrophage mannose receptor 1-like [Physella acuta]